MGKKLKKQKTKTIILKEGQTIFIEIENKPQAMLIVTVINNQLWVEGK